MIIQCTNVICFFLKKFSMKQTRPNMRIAAAVKDSPMAERYNNSEDRRSAYEMLEEVRAEEQVQAEREAKEAEKEKQRL